MSQGARARAFGAIVAACVASLLAATTTTASLFLILTPASGPPGTEVTGRTAGSGAFTVPIEPLRTFLVARTAADGVTNPDDARLVEVGKLVIDPAGDGRITFLVPDVEPGAYSVMVFCPSCAATSAGRTMLWVADFEVTSGSPSTDTVSPAVSSRLIQLGALLLVVAAALLVIR